MLAGHETTSKTVGTPASTILLNVVFMILQLTFGLWELAKHGDVQEKLRTEINETLRTVEGRGDTDFTANDFESMPYLVAFTKVRRNHRFTSLTGINSSHRNF